MCYSTRSHVYFTSWRYELSLVVLVLSMIINVSSYKWVHAGLCTQWPFISHPVSAGSCCPMTFLDGSTLISVPNDPIKYAGLNWLTLPNDLRSTLVSVSNDPTYFAGLSWIILPNDHWRVHAGLWTWPNLSPDIHRLVLFRPIWLYCWSNTINNLNWQLWTEYLGS